MKDIQNITKIRATTTTKALALLVMALATATVAASYYGQEEAAAQGRPDEAVVLAGMASEEARSLAMNIAIEQLLNMTSPSITFRADGTFSISQMDMTPEGDFEITDVDLKHNLTPENGYRYDNGIIYAPNGTQIFP